MKFRLKALAICVALPLTAAMTHADVLTLDDCIELALKNRASIIAARGRETLAKWDQRTALGAFLPRLDASYTYYETKETDIKSDFEVSDRIWVKDSIPALDPDGDSMIWVPIVRDSILDTRIEQFDLPDQDRSGKTLDLSLNMSLFNPSNFFSYAAAKANRAKAHLDVIDSEQNLIYVVKVSYYAYLAAVENLGVQEEAVKRSDEQLKLIQSKYELGSAAKSDVLKQKVQYGNDRLSLLQSQNLVATAHADLAYTIGVDPNSDVTFSTEYEPREFEGTLSQAIGFGLEHEPALLASHKVVDAARHSARSRWAEYLPRLNGFASLQWWDGTRGDTVIFDFSSRSATIGFGITYNIFDGFWRERNLSQARIAHNNARASLADLTNLVTRDIKTAYLETDQLREQRKVAGENVAAAQEDMKITEEKYRLGAATILDLLDAQVSLKEAQVQLIRADFDLNLAIAKLEEAMGKM